LKTLHLQAIKRKISLPDKLIIINLWKSQFKTVKKVDQ
jgi:hypothetical protein